MQSTVVGPDMIFGVLNFWATVNRKIEIKVMRVGECSACLLQGRIVCNVRFVDSGVAVCGVPVQSDLAKKSK